MFLFVLIALVAVVAAVVVCIGVWSMFQSRLYNQVSLLCGVFLFVVFCVLFFVSCFAFSLFVCRFLSDVLSKVTRFFWWGVVCLALLLLLLVFISGVWWCC